MLRVCLIGPGDISYYYTELLGISEKDYLKSFDSIAKVLADTSEIVLLPDEGVCFEVAKLYKQHHGKLVTGTVPTKDTDFGIRHLQPYIDATHDGRKVFDTIIDTQNWYKQDHQHCMFGDVVLVLGKSLGSMGELGYGFYLYKLFVGAKPGITVSATKLHPEARAGTLVPFDVIVCRPFVKEGIGYEIEAYIKKYGCSVHYVDTPYELRELLQKPFT